MNVSILYKINLKKSINFVKIENNHQDHFLKEK